MTLHTSWRVPLSQPAVISAKCILSASANIGTAARVQLILSDPLMRNSAILVFANKQDQVSLASASACAEHCSSKQSCLDHVSIGRSAHASMHACILSCGAISSGARRRQPCCCFAEECFEYDRGGGRVEFARRKAQEMARPRVHRNQVRPPPPLLLLLLPRIVCGVRAANTGTASSNLTNNVAGCTRTCNVQVHTCCAC